MTTSSDPTAIELELDPLVYRMSGKAVHGDTPFDVPYVSELAHNLWQGGCATGLVLPKHIEHVVSLYPWENYTVSHTLQSFLVVRMYDSEEQGFTQVDAIAAWVNCCREQGPTLVHCQAGLNRSSLVAGRALTLSGQMSGAEAVALLREKRSSACLCNPAFAAWLERIE